MRKHGEPIDWKSFKSEIRVGDVIEGHSTNKLYYVTAIGFNRWLGVDKYGREQVRTIAGTSTWRKPCATDRDNFIAHMKENHLV